MIFYKNFILSIFCFFSTCALQAEIDRVTVWWNPIVCQEYCANKIVQSLSQMPSIAEISMNVPAGQVDMRWKPYAPFNYDMLRYAIANTGVPIINVHVVVRGTLSVNGPSIILRSLGDNTQFVLLGPKPLSFTKNVPSHNLEAQALKPELYQQFLSAAQDDSVATVQGFLVRPQIGLFLGVESGSFNRLTPR